MKEGSLSRRRMNSASSTESWRSCSLSVSIIMVPFELEFRLQAECLNLSFRLNAEVRTPKGGTLNRFPKLVSAFLCRRSDQPQFLYPVGGGRQGRVFQHGISHRMLLPLILRQKKHDSFAAEKFFF